MSDWDSSESPDISESESEENSENDGQENETKQTLLRNICAPTAQPISQNPALICDVLVVDDNSRAHIGHVININGPLTLNNLISSSESSPVNVLNHSFSVSSDTQPDTPSALLEKLSENSSSVTNEKCQYYKTASETTNSPTLGVKFHQATLEIARFFTEHTKIAVTLFIFILIVVVIAIVLVTYVTPRNTDINFNYSTNSMTDMLSSSEYTTVTDTGVLNFTLNNHAEELKRLQIDPSFDYYTRMDWGALPPRRRENMIHPILYVIIAHTAGNRCSTFTSCSEMLRNMQEYNLRNPKFNDLVYNFVVSDDGAVYEVRGWNNSSPRRTLANRSLYVAFAGNYENDEMTERQETQTKKFLKYGVDSGYLDPDYKLMAHFQVSSTLSPGKYVFNEIVKWQNYLGLPEEKTS